MGAAAYGVELDPKAVEYARQLGIQNVFCGTMSDLPGDLLGLSFGRTIQIDVNAAGYGWHFGKGEGETLKGEGQRAKGFLLLPFAFRL